MAIVFKSVHDYGGFIPDGKTFTPTDSVQILLLCAGITDKSYTTISQLLADATSLASVIANNNAADYLVRSTTFASDVTADSGAMTLIGANDYCTDELLSDATWLQAICDSTYFESVLNVKIPVLSSDDDGSGYIVSTNSKFNNTVYAYGACDGDDSTNWHSASGSNQYWQIYFPFETRIVRYDWKGQIGYSANDRNLNGVIQGSINGQDWTNITNADCTIVKDGHINFMNTEKYDYYRLTKTNSGYFVQTEIQLYGRA